MKKISWKDKKTDEKSLHTVQEDRKILETTMNRKHRIGHALRRSGVLCDILEERMLGKNMGEKMVTVYGR